MRIGFDIGGTSLKTGILQGERIIAKRAVPFPRDAHYQKTVDCMEIVAQDMLKEKNLLLSQVKSIGVAVAGSLDSQNSKVLDANNLDFHNVPLKAEVMGRFPGIPISLCNDANAAALAELQRGALKGCKTAVLITIGTGIGGGLVLNGEIFNGGLNHGVELGHMVMMYGGSRCTCGNRGCIETLCSARWLARAGIKAARKNKEGNLYQSVNGEIQKVNAKTVIDNAKAGDLVACAIFDQFTDHLSAAISSIAALLDPEVVALGGGVSHAGEFLFQPLREKVRQHSFYKYPYQIVPAKLGNDAGIIGAAMFSAADADGNKGDETSTS